MSTVHKRLIWAVVALVLGMGVATPGWGYVNDRTWSGGGGANQDWGNTNNWNLKILPTIVDRASFLAYYTTQRANLETNTTIGDLRFSAYSTYHVTNNAATLTVTNGLLFDVGAYYDTYLSCVLNLGGKLTTSQSMGLYFPGHLRLLTGGNTLGGGIDVNGVNAVLAGMIPSWPDGSLTTSLASVAD
jgi:hypothetical protein